MTNTNNLLALKPEILTYWDLDEEKKQEAILQKIRKCAKKQTKETFIKTIQENFEFKEFSGLGTIYEALSELPQEWGDFLISEHKRAFEVAENASSPFEVLECLEEVYLKENEDIAARILSIVTPYINHSDPAMRYKGIWISFNWINTDNARKYSHIIQEIIRKLDDEHWKVRFCAAISLRDIERLPKGYSPSFMDKIKAKFSNPYQM